MEQPKSSPLRFAVAGMLSLAVAMGIGRFVYTPILPGMMDELGLSASDAGLIASANYLGYLVGALAAAGGWAHGRERLLVLSALAASTALAALMGAVETMTPFLLIRFAAGVASAFVMVFMTGIVFSHLARAGRGGFEALHFGGVGLGIAVSSLLMAAIVSTHAGWASGWYWSGALSLAGFVLVALLANEGPVGGATSTREPRLPRNAALAKVILAYGLFGFGYVITATFLVAIVRQNGESRLFEAMVWLATGLTAMPSLFVWQRIARRSSVYAAYAAACLLEAVGVAASVAVTGSIGPLAGGVLLGATFMAPTALGIQAARQLAPLSTRRVFAIMTAAFGLGQIVGPIVAGILAERSGSFFLPSMLAALVLVLSAAAAWSAAPKSP
jgi:predicted MFS family arabinose efflux permease